MRSDTTTRPKTATAFRVAGHLLAVALPMACLCLGCNGPKWEHATCLDKLVDFQLASAPHARWCRFGTTLDSARMAPPAVLRREIVKYLKRRPDALKTLIDMEDNTDFWEPWRGRDVWASVLADLEGIELRLYRWDSVEERERKIAALLETLSSDGESRGRPSMGKSLSSRKRF